MAASSSSSNNVQEKYDVFISFRGEDTRNNFTSHLHAALERKKIKTFIDYQLKKGGEISPALEKAIEESKLSLVVFSKDYASSRWCLTELVKIIDCKKSHGQLVIPIFYHITPSEVRKQSGSFEDAFSRYRRTETKDKVQKWKAALIDAAALAGWDSSVTRPESVLIDEIVKDVLKKLNYDSLPYIKGLVGIGSHVMQVKSLLNLDESSDVFSIGIWGMGGIGKTTVAEVVFNQISSQFEGRCFLENVKDKSREHNGLFSLREKLLSKLLDEDGIYLETLRTQCTYIRHRLRQRKVLVVLDDINDPEQFEILVGALDGFGPGSRIIVTSRDKQVLINCRVDEDKIYQVTKLSRLEALELFYRHAFKKNHPPYDLSELSDAAVNYAEGNPLALKVLGSALQSKSSRYWKDTLNKLKQVPNPNIYNVLRISFDMLDDEQKNIFLDIVCFFNEDDMDHIVEILASCYCSIYCGIEDLMDKSLITLSDNVLRSHDLLQEMGWKVVRDESSELGKRSRLWTSEDLYHVLTENSGTELIEGIFLDISKVGKIELSPTVFSRMCKLRLLKFFYSGIEKDPKLLLPEQGLESLPSELRYLYWEGYPLRSLPSNFKLQKLVEFSMPHSNIEHLWDGPMDLVNLKKINLSYSKISSAIKLLPEVRCLTDLDLSGTPIQEIPSSIRCLKQLFCLSLNDCRALNDLPTDIHEMDSLEYMFLSRCTSLTKFPECPENIRYLFLRETAIEEVPSSIDCLSKLVQLDMQNCQSLKSLPSSICKMKSLKHLDFQFCSNLESFPEILEKMERLLVLGLGRTAIKSIPSSIENLINLRNLDLDGTAIKELPPSIENVVGLCTLHFSNAINLAKLPSTFQMTSLEQVFLRNCPALTEFLDNLEDSNTEALSFLSSVRQLYISGNNFKRLPNLGQLSMLEELEISYCTRLKSLPELPPRLQWLDAHHCTSLQRVENFHFDRNIGDYSYRFSNCFKLIQDASTDDIVANAYLNIQLMAAAYVERFNHHQVLSEGASASFSLPTSEIPAWFNNQGVGSSVVVKLPPGWQNSQFLGFAFCIVVEFEDVEYWHVEVDCYLESSQGYSRRFRCSSWRDWLWEWEAADQPISDHLLLLYDHSIHANIFAGDEGDSGRQNSLIEASFRFHLVSHSNGAYTEFAKVKKCGVYLLYKNSNTGECPRNIFTSNEDQPSRSLSIGEEEEEDPQSRSFEEISSSEMHRNLDFGGQKMQDDANRGFNNDDYCCGGTESAANFGSLNADDDDQGSKEILKEFNLWNLIVRFLHFCDVRNCL